MERTSDDRNLDVPAARSGDVNQVPLGTEEELFIRQNKTTQADSVLKSLSPLINSMRVFGLTLLVQLLELRVLWSVSVLENVRRGMPHKSTPRSCFH